MMARQCAKQQILQTLLEPQDSMVGLLRMGLDPVRHCSNTHSSARHSMLTISLAERSGFRPLEDQWMTGWYVSCLVVAPVTDG